MNDQVRMSQWASRVGFRGRQRSGLVVRISLLAPRDLVEVRRAITVTRTLPLDSSEQSMQRAPPGKLRELVDRGNDERRQQTIDLFVDGDDRQSLVRTLAARKVA